MQISGNHVNPECKKLKAVRKMNAEECIVLSIHPWCGEDAHSSQVTPSKTLKFYLELSSILIWSFPDCFLLGLASYINNADYPIWCSSKNPSNLQDTSRGLLWWPTGHAGGDVIHSNQVLYKKNLELSFLSF